MKGMNSGESPLLQEVVELLISYELFISKASKLHMTGFQDHDNARTASNIVQQVHNIRQLAEAVQRGDDEGFHLYLGRLRDQSKH